MEALGPDSHRPDTVSSGTIPDTADVVIVGGGIIGAAAAYYLSKSGLHVVLVEKDEIASQQSGRNWGFIRTQYRDLAELPLAKLALSMWLSLEGELGLSIGWRQNGCIFVAESETQYERYSAWQADAKDMAADAVMLSGAETAKLVPGLRTPVAGALYTPTDGQAEPRPATVAFARAARRSGARILENCGALEIETSGGSVSGVLTERGLIKAPAVVCAAGATSHRFLRGLNLTLPQQIVRNTVSLTAPMEAVSAACFCGVGIGIRRRPDGSCILSSESAVDIDLTLESLRAARFFLPGLIDHWDTFSIKLGAPFLASLQSRFSAMNGNSPIEPRQPKVTPNTRRVGKTVELLNRHFALSKPVSIVKSWAGYIDVLPDAIPVIDCPSSVTGLVVATGFSGHGFGLAPAVGTTIARLCTGTEPETPLDDFRLDRFIEGTYKPPHAPL